MISTLRDHRPPAARGLAVCGAVLVTAFAATAQADALGRASSPKCGSSLRRLLLALPVLLGGRRAHRCHASSAVTGDSGIGRRVRPLGPASWEITADRETVFDVIASPYLGKTPRALQPSSACKKRREQARVPKRD